MSITISGPSNLTLQPSDKFVTANYFAAGGGRPIVWSVNNIDYGGLDPADVTVEIDQFGILRVTLADGTVVPPGTTVTFNVRAVGRGNNQAEYPVSVDISPGTVPCFVEGTLIATENGPVPVEDLRVGQKVKTFEGRFAPISWIGERRFEAAELEMHPWLRPIQIKPDAFGPGTPNRDLFVSPQHKLCLSGWQAELFFGESEILVPACFLINGDSVCRVDNLNPVRYFHFVLDRHEIIFAEGLAAETLCIGQMALAGFDKEQRRELQAFLSGVDENLHQIPVALSLKRREAQILLGNYT